MLCIAVWFHCYCAFCTLYCHNSSRGSAIAGADADSHTDGVIRQHQRHCGPAVRDTARFGSCSSGHSASSPESTLQARASCSLVGCQRCPAHCLVLAALQPWIVAVFRQCRRCMVNMKACKRLSRCLDRDLVTCLVVLPVGLPFTLPFSLVNFLSWAFQFAWQC